MWSGDERCRRSSPEHVHLSVYPTIYISYQHACIVRSINHGLRDGFHLHGNLFHYFPTGTSLEPTELTDTVMLCQGQRGILEWRFPYPGRYMFHAHQSEFTELGWQGFFEVT